jgi:N-acetylglutamate synthase-like GNAT family acetyltransferase
MSDDAIRIARTEDFAAVRLLGVACGLDDSARGDAGITAAWGAFDEECLIGAIVLENCRDLVCINWMAVDPAYRRRGIAGRLCAALECEAQARGITRLWATARTPAFFLACGFEAVTDARVRDLLTQDCRDCEQFGHGCFPRPLTKRIDDPGPPRGPRIEGDT